MTKDTTAGGVEAVRGSDQADILRRRAAKLREQAPRELIGLHREWPHHAAQARRSYREMLAEADALDAEAQKLADAHSKSDPHPEPVKEG